MMHRHLPVATLGPASARTGQWSIGDNCPFQKIAPPQGAR